MLGTRTEKAAKGGPQAPSRLSVGPSVQETLAILRRRWPTQPIGQRGWLGNWRIATVELSKSFPALKKMSNAAVSDKREPRSVGVVITVVLLPVIVADPRACTEVIRVATHVAGSNIQAVRSFSTLHGPGRRSRQGCQR